MSNFAVLFLAFGLLFTGVHSASSAVRTLKLYFVQTKESADITFKRNGRYVPSGLKKLNRFLRDWRRNEPTKMDPRLFDLIWEVYRKSGSRARIQVVSGYRSPKTNRSLRRRGRGVAAKSLHLKGQAFDFFLPDVSVEKLRSLGLKAQAGGVGYYRGSFIHLDTGRVRHWPRMSRRQLAKVFPRGRTLHIPSDGKPLAGYQYALAKYKKRGKTGNIQIASASRPSLLRRLFSGGADAEEDAANIRKGKTKAKPKPKKTSATASARKKTKGSELPGVNVASAPKVRDEQKKSPATKRPEAQSEHVPERVIVPTPRPEQKPEDTAGETTIASLIAEDSAADAASQRAPAEDDVALSSASSTKIQESRFALVLTPQLTPTQRAAEALATQPAERILTPTPSPKQDNSPDKPSGKSSAIGERIELALLQPDAASKRNDSLSRPPKRALGVQAKPVEAKKAKVAIAEKIPKVSSKSENQPEIRIERAFAALTPDQSDVTSVAIPSSAPRSAVNDEREIKVASLEPGITKPTARPISVFGEKRKTILPRKTAKPPVIEYPVAAPRTSERALFQLGNLNGRDVTSWAISYSTRVGNVAILTAPRYLGALKEGPDIVFNASFGNSPVVSRVNRFSGQAIRRIAFAKFTTVEAPRGEVFLTDRY